MNIDSPISEIANLAKDKGFKAKTLSTIHTFEHFTNNGKNFKINDTCLFLLACEIQKWLREVHNIEVNANVNFYNKKVKLGYYYTIDKFDENNIHDGKNYDYDQISIIGNEEGNNTFEEALEVGLQEALKLIEIVKSK